MTTRTRGTDSDLEHFERPALGFQEPIRTWAGHGNGAACNLCGRSIKKQEIEYEVELSSADAGRSLRFHFHCYRAWEAQNRGGV